MNHEPASPIPVPDDIVEALDCQRPRFGSRGVPKIVYFASVGSTNDVASRLADAGAADGTAVAAELQSAGRGRLGRTWFSPPGAGLYISIVVRPDEDSGRLDVGQNVAPFPAGIVTLAAGVAFAEALRAISHLPIDIKWPNDLVIGRRKLAGILTEAFGGLQIQHLIVGIGINIRSAAYPSDIADRATSIEAELGRPIDRGLVLAECLARFSECMAELRDNRVQEVLGRWRSLAPTATGALIEWTSPAGQRAGTTAGLDTDGALLVKTSERLERVIAGEIRWV